MANKAKSDHQIYFEGSPYYRAVFEQYGARVSEDTARKLVKSHGMSMDDMREEGLRPLKSGQFDSLHIVQCLGY